MNNLFRRFAHFVSQVAGSPWAFIFSIVLIGVWLLCGPIFHYSDTWQLVINTTTTIITFLMVFIIQNSQNRDAESFHLKLNELIRGVKGARSELVNLEELPDEELASLHAEFKALHERLGKHIQERTGSHKKG
jgi:low affinity Fe/Cu permease